MNEKRGGDLQRIRRNQAFEMIAGFLANGIALTGSEAKALLVGHGYSPRTTLWDAMGFKAGGSAFSRITGVPLEECFHRGRKILAAGNLPYGDTGIERAEQRIDWAMSHNKMGVRS